jgi:hypothetical protein
MTIAPTPHRLDPGLLLDRSIDDLLLRLRGLVLVGGILEQRGATDAEVAEHAREAERVRVRLARLIAGRDGDPPGDVAA